MPPASAGVRPAPQDEWALRDFGGVERVPGKDYEPDPLVVVLCSFTDGPLAGLQAGQALQRVLLTATDLGLAASFLSQAVEVRSVRQEPRHSIGGAVVPQSVLRVGFGSPVPPTPRRAVEDLLPEGVPRPGGDRRRDPARKARCGPEGHQPSARTAPPDRYGCWLFNITASNWPGHRGGPSVHCAVPAPSNYPAGARAIRLDGHQHPDAGLRRPARWPTRPCDHPSATRPTSG
ncbi:hypothetical protein [Saccharothrix yanglingensis]|uniref:hypothetical protein n=1 Tax=Saccharothrix yanglingensis TaxID=659496 RepID=UPI0027D301CC|nr:hypothetical protein [Saccharothrix yanglingensis]